MGPRRESRGPAKGEQALADRRQLDRFLAGVERPAYRLARLALYDPDDALDAVQDAMFKLVKHYADRPEVELKPLFYGILRRRIVDLQRRRAVRNRVIGWFARPRDSGDEDPLANAPDPADPDPFGRVANERALEHLSRALRRLPERQQQAFMFRLVEELDVAETARAMGCSAGSVKTHLSRAVRTLRAQLEAHT